MEIPETKRFIPKGFELGTIMSKPIRSIAYDISLSNYGRSDWSESKLILGIVCLHVS